MWGTWSFERSFFSEGGGVYHVDIDIKLHVFYRYLQFSMLFR